MTSSFTETEDGLSGAVTVFHVGQETAPFQVTSITGMFQFDILADAAQDQTDKGHRNSNSLHSHH